MSNCTTGTLCAVDGCRSSKRKHKHLSYFQLPPDIERRMKWIKLIGRPDLARENMRIGSHFVCSLHFDRNIISYKPQLRPNALPSKLLPSEPSSSTEDKTYRKDYSTQTKYLTIRKLPAVFIERAEMKSESVQTIEVLSPSTQKRKPNMDLDESNSKSRRFQNELDKSEQTFESDESQSSKGFSIKIESLDGFDSE